MKFHHNECPTLFSSKRLLTHKQWKCKEFSNKTRLGGEITKSDVMLPTGNRPIGPLQLAIHDQVVQNRHAGTQKLHWGKTTKRHT